jgi:hypothetical protein
MKKMSVLLAFFALLFAHFAFAQGMAVVTSVTGSAQVQTGAGSPRVLRQGDEVRQGDTVSTAANSSLVLKFDDGEVAALTQNSRMVITAYQYQPETRAGNVLLSLVTGGMRAITGLIGRTQPERVAYRAATATIGIRGTDVDVITDGNNVAVYVHDGEIRFSYRDQTINVHAGQAAFTADGQIKAGPAETILRQLPPAFQPAVGGLDTLIAAINAAGAGLPRGGEGNEGQGQSTSNIGSPSTYPCRGGGGSVSQR